MLVDTLSGPEWINPDHVTYVRWEQGDTIVGFSSGYSVRSTDPLSYLEPPRGVGGVKSYR